MIINRFRSTNHPLRNGRTVQRVAFGGLAAASVLFTGLAITNGGVASAHHPDLSVDTTCTSKRHGLWSATFTARPDAGRPELTWQILDPGGYSPGGAQPATVDSTFTKTYSDLSSASQSETVTASWSNGAQDARTAVAERPVDCAPRKVWVCKYVTTPGGAEELQTGSNPIDVSESTIADPVVVGASFSDSHGRSYVVQIGGSDPGLAACPMPDNPQPPTPEPTVVEVWNDCVTGAESIMGTRTTTNFTYVLQDGTWVEVQDGAAVVEEVSRPLDASEQAACAPPAKVTTSDWEDGSYECGDTTVAQTRTRTVTPYVSDPSGAWVLDTNNAVGTTETRTRDLGDDEIEQCPTSTPVTPAGPDLTPPTCLADGSYTVPGVDGAPEEAGVVYEVSDSDDEEDEVGTVIITAVAEQDFVIEAGAQTIWKVSPSDITRLTGQQCGTTTTTTTTVDPVVAALPPTQQTTTTVAPPAGSPPAGAPTSVAPPVGQLPVTGGSPWNTVSLALAAIGMGYLVVRLTKRSA